ncbi:DUF2804 domain-containing protein [Cellulomonas chengniuliangii]|uniref:DUF2804 domain-containing protein n=1 Tax=Cellulomonas chengniuliangii TaxID=2968084 RepID=UPI001D0DCFEE|nr:DUF2804 domain-containing protein [Cellulomonas chengniuliangii]MCC2318737.1 DUF2804 domain-containing protein [Cellulomonas chengniuliangii]
MPTERDVTASEREITEPVDLCLPSGRLNPAAVGWSRRRLHRTALRGWGRAKRWEYWGVMTPTHVIGLTVASLDYAAQHQLWVLDRATGEEVDRVAVVPFARGAVLPASLGGGPASARARGMEATITEGDCRTRLRARTDRVQVDLLSVVGENHESLGVVVPWSDRQFQYTVKDVARPVTGTIVVDGTAHDVPEDGSWAVLDHGRGRWPYSMRWNWGAGSGVVDGHVVGVQVGGRWTDGTGSTENALMLDERVHKNSDELVWEYDRADWLAPWRVHDAARERVDLTFTPFHERASRMNLGIVAGETHQCFGTWTGWMTTDAGDRVRVDGVEGWAEEARNRW